MKCIQDYANKLLSRELIRMFERHHEKLLPRHAFLKRLAKYALISLGLVAASLVVGMIGYHMSEGYSWVDSCLNASMLMGGMGPVNALHANAGKIFAGYMLYTAGL